jgi:catechol-2,3-dioxygenase
MLTMLDHVFVSVRDLDRSIAFYEKALAPLGILHTIDYDGTDGPEGPPDLKGFGRDGRVFFWLRQGHADPRAVHVGFVARNEAEVNAFYAALLRGLQPMASRAPAFTTTRDTTPLTSSIPKATVSKWSTRVGNIRSHSS